MKFNVSSALLSERLQTVSRVVSNKNTLPILNYILFSIEGNTLSLTASDLDVTVQTSLQLDSVEGEGKVAVMPKYVLDILHEFSDQPLSFDVDENSFAIEIKCGKGRYNFIGQSGDEFPKLKDLQEDCNLININGELLLDGLGQTLHASANDDMRPIMNGVCMDFTEESLNLVGTDAQKLARFRIFEIKSEQPSSCVLPQKPALLLKGILSKYNGDLKLSFDSSNILFELPDYTLYCRRIEGSFPNYNAVIPKDNPIKVIIDRQLFLSAVRRVHVCTNQASSLVKFEISENQLHMSGQDIDFSVAGEDYIPCQYEGDEMEIGFKANLVIDILSNLTSSEVILELADSARPGLFVPFEQEEDRDVLMLLVPMSFS